MSAPSPQAPRAVVMIRPHRFAPNRETAHDNAFQRMDDLPEATALASAAHREVTAAVRALEAAGVGVHLFEDEGVDTPDSVFPNNWFSTHAGGHVAIFPMASPSRRGERRSDVVEWLKRRYRVQDVIDYSGLEADGVFLEGTGAMVLDHLERVAYAVRSKRTDPIALERFCTHFNFEPMVFDAVDADGRAIYHTNVLMCIGTEIALIGLDRIVDPRRRAEVRARLEGSGRTVIDLTREQIADFAGNAIELDGTEGRLLAVSERALRSLGPEQIATIEARLRILPLAIPTIERAGGSVRCMLAGIHLSPRPEVAGEVARPPCVG